MKVLEVPRALGSKELDPLAPVKSPALYNDENPIFWSKDILSIPA
jgi:hypothetical protein